MYVAAKSGDPYLHTNVVTRRMSCDDPRVSHFLRDCRAFSDTTTAVAIEGMRERTVCLFLGAKHMKNT